MRRFLMILSLFAGLLLAFGASASAATVPNDGPTLSDGAAAQFTAFKCDKCHSIKSKSVPCLKPDKVKKDLSKIGEDADFLTKYLKKEVNKEVKGKQKKHPKKWKGSDAELAKMIKWLQG